MDCNLEVAQCCWLVQSDWPRLDSAVQLLGQQASFSLSLQLLHLPFMPVNTAQGVLHRGAAAHAQEERNSGPRQPPPLCYVPLLPRVPLPSVQSTAVQQTSC